MRKFTSPFFLLFFCFCFFVFFCGAHDVSDGSNLTMDKQLQIAAYYD